MSLSGLFGYHKHRKWLRPTIHRLPLNVRTKRIVPDWFCTAVTGPQPSVSRPCDNPIKAGPRTIQQTASLNAYEQALFGIKPSMRQSLRVQSRTNYKIVQLGSS